MIDIEHATDSYLDYIGDEILHSFIRSVENEKSLAIQEVHNDIMDELEWVLSRSINNQDSELAEEIHMFIKKYKKPKDIDYISHDAKKQMEGLICNGLGLVNTYDNKAVLLLKIRELTDSKTDPFIVELYTKKLKLLHEFTIRE